MCCRHTSLSGSFSQRCCSDFGSQKNELATGSDMQVHTMFVTNHGIWQQHLTGGHLLLSGHRAIPSAMAALCHLQGRKPNWWVESTIKLFNILTRCQGPFASVSNQSPKPTPHLEHLFSSICISFLILIIYVNKQTKKSWGIMRRHCASEYFKETEFFFFGQLLQATLLKIWLEVYIYQGRKSCIEVTMSWVLSSQRTPPKWDAFDSLQRGSKRKLQRRMKILLLCTCFSCSQCVLFIILTSLLHCSKHAEAIQFSSPVWSACQEGVILPSPSPALFWTQI